MDKTKAQSYAYDPAKDKRWGDINFSVAIPVRRKKIKRLTSTKPPIIVTRAIDLAKRVDALWTALDHDAMECFTLDVFAITGHACDVKAYFAQLPRGDDKRAS